MIPKIPSYSKGYKPKLSTILQYLENDASQKRDDVLYIDGFNGIDIENESYYKDYWYGIISPSELECRELTEHYNSDASIASDPHYAATQHGQQLIDKLQSKLGFKHITTAISWRKNDNNISHWCYHLVGLGKPTSRLDGHNGALQEAWRKASITIDKPVVDDIEHKLEIAIKDELIAIAERYRSLTTARYKAVRAVAPEDKMATRTSFNELENQLIEQRFTLKQKMIKHHYAARNDVGSLAHQIAQEKNNNERSSSLTRVANRGLSLATIIANKKELNKAIAAEKKAIFEAKKAARLVRTAKLKTAKSIRKKDNIKAKSPNKTRVTKLVNKLIEPITIDKYAIIKQSNSYDKYILAKAINIAAKLELNNQFIDRHFNLFKQKINKLK